MTPTFVYLPVKPQGVWRPTAVEGQPPGEARTPPFLHRAAAVPAGPSLAPEASAASSPPAAPAAAAARAPSAGGCSRKPRGWLPDRCPVSTVCR